MDTPPPRNLPLAFTASGSEYFRIWVINVLLVVVTLGFYLPFAKARRLRYFYANVSLDGPGLARIPLNREPTRQEFSSFRDSFIGDRRLGQVQFRKPAHSF